MSALIQNRYFLTHLLLIAVALIAWGGVPWGTFQYDDFTNVVRDPSTTEPTALAERLLHGLRPLTRLSYFFDAQLYGLQAAGFLFTNLILHLATVLLVFALASRRIDIIGACVAALFFALQPANAEVVAYVSGRSTGLMTPLLLCGLLMYDCGKRTAALLLFALACLAKEVALVFPALVLIWEITRAEPRPHVKREIIGLTIATAAIFALLISLANYRSLIAYSFALRSVPDNLLANGRAIPVMLSLWVRPWALSPDHEFDSSVHIAESIGGLVLLAGVMAAALVLHRRRWLALVLMWPLIALLPTNSIIAKIDLVTERPLYLAWVGPSLALGAAFSSLMVSLASRTLRRRVLFVVTGVLACVLIGASFLRASMWRDPALLWVDATAKAPGKSRCWNNLGMSYLITRRDAEAVTAFERAIRLDPANKIALANLGTARLLCGQPCTQD